jgi:lysophospholipase L1-like esterase
MSGLWIQRGKFDGKPRLNEKREDPARGMMDKSGPKIAFIGDSLTEGVTGASYFDILKCKLPQHELYNYGKGGETVISLCRRLQKIHMVSPLDTGFLWVGVNDVLVKTSWFSPIKKRLRGQPWAKDHTHFRESYLKLLEFLSERITHLYTLPPLFIGEDTGNEWNMELRILSKIIDDLSSSFPNIDFVRLIEHFPPRSSSENIPPYVPKSLCRVFGDILFPMGLEKSELKAAERGFHFTIDGVHLNRAGAEKIANLLLKIIRSKPPLSTIDS